VRVANSSEALACVSSASLLGLDSGSACSGPPLFLPALTAVFPGGARFRRIGDRRRDRDNYGNAERGFAVTTDAKEFYGFPELPIGKYDVEIAANLFATMLACSP